MKDFKEYLEEAKKIGTKVEVTKGPDKGKIGYVRQIQRGEYGNPSAVNLDLDLEGGGELVVNAKHTKQLKESLDEAFAKDYSGMIGKFVKAVRQAEKAKDDKKRDRHLKNAFNRLMGMKSSDMSKLDKIPEYELYNKMKGIDEGCGYETKKKVEEEVPATSTANVDFTPTKRDKRKKDDTETMYRRAKGTKFIEKMLADRKNK